MMRSIKMMASSTNLSEFTKNTPEENNDAEMQFEGSDGGEQVESMFNSLNGDQMLLNMLTSLDTRDKVVLLYQVLRQSGYNLEHEECAKTLSLSRAGYVTLLKNVKKKCQKVLSRQKIV
jgi:DNA-directed RNA polymerase specialized sigma24 family protein